MPLDLAADSVKDLLRSSWLVERARAALYRRWAADEPRYEGSVARAEERASIVSSELERRSGRTDEALVEAHAEWIMSLAGRWPGEQPLGDIFVARLGDWMEAHASPFLGDIAERVAELGRDERSILTLPEALPAAPPFEPVKTSARRPPGRLLFRFAILGDLHFGSPSGETMARAAIADINRSGAELVVQLGDITDHGDPDEYELAASVLLDVQAPLVTMMGNHDVFSYSTRSLDGRDLYRKHFGRDPDGTLLEHKGFRFAILDSAEHAASPFAPYNLVTGAFMEGKAGAVVRGSLSTPQHEILADVAAPGGGPAFVFLHHPPQPFTGFPPVVFGLRDQDSGRLHAVADSGNVWGVFAGHTHRNARTRVYGSVPVHEVGIPRDFPFGYALVDVSNKGYVFSFMQLSDERLLMDAYKNAGRIHRRYALGREEDRSFVWRVPD
jgi:3',5'-cyclic-AMP phosphodiesterase